jgi:hypothetical protein
MANGFTDQNDASSTPAAPTEITIKFSSNANGGASSHVKAQPGITAGQFFAKHHPGASAGDYVIRVNRVACRSDQVLEDGFSLSVTPTKIQGADEASVHDLGDFRPGFLDEVYA